MILQEPVYFTKDNRIISIMLNSNDSCGVDRLIRSKQRQSCFTAQKWQG